MYSFYTYNIMEQTIDEKMTGEALVLYNEDIGDAGMKYLCEKDTTKVKDLDLSRNSITANGALHFNRGQWSRLTALQLNNNTIGNKGCQYLSRASVGQLEYLNLGKNKIENQGVSHLAKARWNQLNEIYLDGNKISFNAISPITKANWKQLYFISLDSNRLTVTDCLRIILSETVIQFIWLNYNSIKAYQEKTFRKGIRDKFKQIVIQI